MAIHVLVVDDSAVVRQTMLGILSQDPSLVVSAANDPLIAMDKMRLQRPDVILLDLEMPRMDGMTFLRKIMAEDPIPVVICSSVAGQGTDTALRALDEGAVEILTKPKLGVRDFLQESSVTLIDIVHAASRARLSRRLAARPRASADAVLPRQRPGARPGKRLVAIGASTGGPEALRAILEALPVEVPGVVVVQHMPEFFTAAFARRLDSSCRVEVREAKDGDQVREGLALIAPGNLHTLVHRRADSYVVEVREGPFVSRHRPSADVLFRSVAQAAGAQGIGVILTGMGDDGAEGLLEMRAAGAATFAQDEASSVVFGMPREAILRGAAAAVVPLPEMAAAVLHAAARHDS